MEELGEGLGVGVEGEGKPSAEGPLPRGKSHPSQPECKETRLSAVLPRSLVVEVQEVFWPTLRSTPSPGKSKSTAWKRDSGGND